LFDNLADTVTLERYARVVTVQMGGSSGYAFPLMSGRQVKDIAVKRTVTLSYRVGRAVSDARRDHKDPVLAILGHTGGEVVFRGKVVDVDRRLVAGFARGRLKLDSHHRSLLVIGQGRSPRSRSPAAAAASAAPAARYGCDLPRDKPLRSLMDVLLDALGYQARQPHQEDVSTSSTDAHKELLATFVDCLDVRACRHAAMHRGRERERPGRIVSITVRSLVGACRRCSRFPSPREVSL